MAVSKHTTNRNTFDLVVAARAEMAEAGNNDAMYEIARRAFMSTPPTTYEGIAAQLRFMAEICDGLAEGEVISADAFLETLNAMGGCESAFITLRTGKH